MPYKVKHSSCPDVIRASMVFHQALRLKQGVDGRVEPGHDVFLHRCLFFALLLLPCFFIGSAQAAERIAIGFISTLSDSGASVGRDLLDGIRLGLKYTGGKLGNREAEIIWADDRGDPKLGRELAARMVNQDRVNLLTGPIYPDVFAQLLEETKSGRLPVIGLVPLPSKWAGEGCRANLFSLVSSEGALHGAMARHLSQSGMRDVAAIFPDSPSGREALAAFRQAFQGKLTTETLVPLGRMNHSELLLNLRRTRPEGVYVGLAGGMAVSVMRQLALPEIKEETSFFGPYSLLDPHLLPALGEAALGAINIGPWSEDPESPLVKKFITDFEEEYRRPVSPHAAIGFDLVLLLDTAIKGAGNEANSNIGLRNAIRSIEFTSLRGIFRFASNQFPNIPLFLRQVWRDHRGRVVNQHRGPIAGPALDPAAAACRLRNLEETTATPIPEPVQLTAPTKLPSDRRAGDGSSGR
jgi:branched-chain amino acid transport system substrate-binding protein